MRVHVKLILLFLAESLLLVAIGLVINESIQKHYNEQMMDRIKNQIDIAAEQFQKNLHSIDQCVLELSISDEVNIFSMYTWETNRNAIYDNSRNFNRQLQAMVSSYKGLNNMWLIFTKQDRQITESVRYDAVNRELHEMLLSATDGFVVDYSDLYYVSALSTSSIYGEGSLVAAKVSLSELMEDFLMSVGGGVEAGLLYDEISLVGDSFVQEKNLLMLREWQRGKKGWIMTWPISIDSGNNQIMYLEIFLPFASLRISQYINIIWNMVLVLTCVVEILISYVLLRRLIMKPLDTLTHAFDQVSCGDMNVEILYNNEDDFSDIYYQFNENTKRLNLLIEKEYKSQMEARIAEVKYLQAQINPHFLYNAFYQTYRLCRAEGGEESAEFALLLSGYFEYITHDSDKDGLVFLSEEIKQAEKYVRIQQFRYADHIQFQVDISEEIQMVRVPKLILQPIIENAVKHGFEEKTVRKDLLVRVTGKWVEEYLLLIVEDNGTELDEIEIVELQQKLSFSDSLYGRSGLVNVHARLKMTSEDGGCNLAQSELGGLRVEMKIGRL